MRWKDGVGSSLPFSPTGPAAVVGVTLFLLLVAATPFAASSGVLAEEVERCERTIAGWEAQAVWSRGLQIGVIVLGALVAALQRFEGRRVKVAVVAMGCAVSIATGISPLVFPVERARLNASVLDGRALVFEMKTVLEAMDQASAGDREVLQQEFRRRLEAFGGIERTLKIAMAVLPGVQVAHAASAGPEEAPPADKAQYGTGEARAAGLKEARTLALENAVDQLTKQLLAADPGWRQQPPVLLRAMVAARAEEVGSSPVYDSAKGTWRYSVRLRISEVASRWDLARALNAYTYVEGAAALEGPGAGEITVPVKAEDPREAHFDFTFTVRPQGEGRTAVELVRLNTIAGGSSGDTRWLFEVFLNDKRILRFAERREYAGGLGGPPRPDASNRGIVDTPEGPLILRVQGARAKSGEVAF